MSEEREITKEIKNLKELENDLEENTKELETNLEDEIEESFSDEKEEKEQVEEEVKEKTKKGKKSNEKKPVNKKIIFIIGGIVLVIVIVVILLVVLSKGKKEEQPEKKKNNDSKFVSSLKSSIKSGSFDKEIKKGLQEVDISTASVCVLSLDIDSDDAQEVVVYAEDIKNKALLQLEVDESVTYDSAYMLNSKDSLGYTYSSEKLSNFWYTEFDKTYTVISSAKKILKEENFLNEYFPLTKTYKEKPVLDQCTKYKLNKELKAKDLEKNAITNKDLIKDNKIDESKIREAFDNYLKDKAAKEEAAKKEAEAKAKEAEEKKKYEGLLRLGDRAYKYGTYDIYTKDGELDGKMVLYANGTCVYKGISCSYTVGEVVNEENEKVPGFFLDTKQSFMASEEEGVLQEAKGEFTAKYVG